MDREKMKLSIMSSAISIDDSLIRIFSYNTKRRSLYGYNSLVLRTFGNNFSIDSFEEKYFDDHRGKVCQTEYAEVIEAMKNYDENPNIR